MRRYNLILESEAKAKYHRLLEQKGIPADVQQTLEKNDITVKVNWKNIETLLEREIPESEKKAFISKFGLDVRLLTILAWVAGASSVFSTASTLILAPIATAVGAAGHFRLSWALFGINALTTIFECGCIFLYIVYRSSFYLRYRNESAETVEEAKTLRQMINKYFLHGRGKEAVKMAIPIFIRLVKNMIADLYDDTKKAIANAIDKAKRHKFTTACIMLLAICVAINKVEYAMALKRYMVYA